jgi:esterase/lipase superfamily enzyme
VEDSEAEIAAFLKCTAHDSGATAVHIIAHSMGNRGLARAASRTLADAGVRFANIILAAPDVQQKLFRELAQTYPRIADRTTLYVSQRDLALKASRWLQDAPRAGLTPPVTIVPGIDTIQVSQFNLLDLGHGYWAQAREVISDIALLMRYAAAPPREFHREVSTDDGPYWDLL